MSEFLVQQAGGSVVGYTGLSANELKEGIEREEFAQSMHKEAFVRKMGKDRAEQYLAAKERRRLRG